MNCGQTELNWGWPEASTLTLPVVFVLFFFYFFLLVSRYLARHKKDIVFQRNDFSAIQGRSIRPCACCQYLCQHIFDHHSSIFPADVALDKHCMTSSQKFWQRTKVPQGHWLLLFTAPPPNHFSSTVQKNICVFFVSPLQTCNSLWHGTNYFIIIRCVFLLFPLTSRSRQLRPSCWLAQPRSYHKKLSTCFEFDVNCIHGADVWRERISHETGFYCQVTMC